MYLIRVYLLWLCEISIYTSYMFRTLISITNFTKTSPQVSVLSSTAVLYYLQFLLIMLWYFTMLFTTRYVMLCFTMQFITWRKGLLTFTWVVILEEFCKCDPATSNSNHHSVVEESYQTHLLFLSHLQQYFFKKIKTNAIIQVCVVTVRKLLSEFPLLLLCHKTVPINGEWL